MDEQTARQLAAQLRKPEGEAGIETGKWMNQGNVHINRDTLTILDAQPNDRILEIGMGNGFFVPEILKINSGIRYTGCDYSDVMVQQATELNQAWVNSGQARFVEAPADQMPFEDNSFNKIFTINTIYFWEDADAVLREIRRVLTPDGIFIIALRPKRQMQNYPFIEFGFRLFSQADVVTLLEKHEFAVVKTIEHQEPDYEAEGVRMNVENLIVVGKQ